MELALFGHQYSFVVTCLLLKTKLQNKQNLFARRGVPITVFSSLLHYCILKVALLRKLLEQLRCFAKLLKSEEKREEVKVALVSVTSGINSASMICLTKMVRSPKREIG